MILNFKITVFIVFQITKQRLKHHQNNCPGAWEQTSAVISASKIRVFS